MADAADALLLSLEVEAAAARNAELCRTVESLQDEVLHLRRVNASLEDRCQTCDPPPASRPRSEPAPTHTAATADGTGNEARDVFVILDDLFFEVAEMRSRASSDAHVDLTPREFSRSSTVTVRAARCLREARQLKEALVVRQRSDATQVSELRRALGEQIAAAEQERAAAAAQRAELAAKCDALQHKLEEAVVRQGELVLNRVMQSPAPGSPGRP